MNSLKEISKESGFNPAWWAPGAHAQTILSALLPSPSLPGLKRERFDTEDGDFLDVDWLEGKPDAPVVVLLHGLEGSSSSPYIRAMLSLLHQRGWHGAAVNMRGCSGEDNRLSVSYHAGKTEDLEFIIQQLLKKKPRARFYIVGYSLGGNMLLKWLGETDAKIPAAVTRAAAVSVPYDLSQSVRHLDAGFNKAVYTRLMLAGLKRKTLRKEKKLPGLVSREIVRSSDTFACFDEAVTAKINGFESAEQYWRDSSAQNYLEGIQTPTLLIHAADDPFFPGRFLPREKIGRSKYLDLLMTDQGGHLGFVSGSTPWTREFWLEDTLLNFFTETG